MHIEPWVNVKGNHIFIFTLMKSYTPSSLSHLLKILELFSLLSLWLESAKFLLDLTNSMKIISPRSFDIIHTILSINALHNATSPVVFKVT